MHFRLLPALPFAHSQKAINEDAVSSKTLPGSDRDREKPELSDATNGTRVWGKWRIQGTIVVGTSYRVDLLL